MADHGEKPTLAPASDSRREEWGQNRRCVRLWDSRFSCLFVYVRGKTLTSDRY